MNSNIKLLVQTCCAPCLVYMNKYFKDNKINYTSLYYNPNIHPYKEYIRRYETLKQYLLNEQIDLIHIESFMQNKWEQSKNNCDFCYSTRLETTAKYASLNNYTHFTTSLLISPYQDHEKIISISNKLEEKYNINFYYYDFRENYREGQNMARDIGLYRQKYCGCINSYNDSKFKDKITWD